MLVGAVRVVVVEDRFVDRRFVEMGGIMLLRLVLLSGCARALVFVDVESCKKCWQTVKRERVRVGSL